MRLKTVEFGLEALFFVKEGNDLGFLELRKDLVVGGGLFERLLGFRDSTAVVEKESSEFRMVQSNREYPYKHTLSLHDEYIIRHASYVMHTTQRNAPNFSPQIIGFRLHAIHTFFRRLFLFFQSFDTLLMQGQLVLTVGSLTLQVLLKYHGIGGSTQLSLYLVHLTLQVVSFLLNRKVPAFQIRNDSLLRQVVSGLFC
jgi:hypothetical protein